MLDSNYNPLTDKIYLSFYERDADKNRTVIPFTYQDQLGNPLQQQIEYYSRSKELQVSFYGDKLNYPGGELPGQYIHVIEITPSSAWTVNGSRQEYYFNGGSYQGCAEYGLEFRLSYPL